MSMFNFRSTNQAFIFFDVETRDRSTVMAWELRRPVIRMDSETHFDYRSNGIWSEPEPVGHTVHFELTSGDAQGIWMPRPEWMDRDDLIRARAINPARPELERP